MAATLRCDTIQNASSATANLTLDASGNVNIAGVIDGLSTPGTATGTGSTSGGTLAAATYYVRIVAFDSAGNTTNAGTESTGVTTTGSTSSIAYTWTAVTGATGYRVYFSTTSGTYASGYFVTTSASYTLTTTSGSFAVGLPSSNTTGISLMSNQSFKRNRIINGDMRVDQRNAGAAVTISSSTGYAVDRTFCSSSGGGIYTAQRSTTVPSGFTNSLALTVTTADSSIAAGDVYYFCQLIEGYNSADFGFGASGAASVTLSFWVRSSITGTYAGSLRNNAANRSYCFSYTVNSANIWEQKSITIAGDTSGTWLTDNSIGISVAWDLGSGTNFNGTNGAWTSGNYLRSSGAVNWIANAGATFYITGVQLEVGSIATPYERQIYSEQLAQCQRYYQYWGGSANYERVASGFWVTNTTSEVEVPRISVTMRATPTLTYSSVSDWNASNYNTNYVCTAIQIGNSSPSSCSFALTSATGAAAGSVAVMVANNTLNARLGLNAEL